jgi:BarA-like signal transduction histidine kinase
LEKLKSGEILLLSISLLFAVPIIIISQATQKVTYEGNLSEHPLQHIYDAMNLKI